MKRTIYNSPKVNKMFKDAERYMAYTKLKEYYDIVYEEIEEIQKGEKENERNNISIFRFNE